MMSLPVEVILRRVPWRELVTELEYLLDGGGPDKLAQAGPGVPGQPRPGRRVPLAPNICRNPFFSIYQSRLRQRDSPRVGWLVGDGGCCERLVPRMTVRSWLGGIPQSSDRPTAVVTAARLTRNGISAGTMQDQGSLFPGGELRLRLQTKTRKVK